MFHIDFLNKYPTGKKFGYRHVMRYCTYIMLPWFDVLFVHPWSNW